MRVNVLRVEGGGRKRKKEKKKKQRRKTKKKKSLWLSVLQSFRHRTQGSIYIYNIDIYRYIYIAYPPFCFHGLGVSLYVFCAPHECRFAISLY